MSYGKNKHAKNRTCSWRVFAKPFACAVGARDGNLEEGCNVISADFVDRERDGKLTIVIVIRESTLGERPSEAKVASGRLLCVMQQ